MRKNILLFIGFFIFWASSFCAKAQSAAIQKLMGPSEQLRLNGNYTDALHSVQNTIEEVRGAESLAFLYFQKTRILCNADSLLAAKTAADRSLEYGNKAGTSPAKAVGLLSAAYLNNVLEDADSLMSEAKAGLKIIEGNSDQDEMKMLFHYLLYSAYSRWNDDEKMLQYAQNAAWYAEKAGNKNMEVNAYNALSSSYQVRYSKDSSRKFLDSSLLYLNKSALFSERFPGEIGKFSAVMAFTNLANYYVTYHLTQSNRPRALAYLNQAEEIIGGDKNLQHLNAMIYGIKSDLALAEKNIPAAEALLLSALGFLEKSANPPLYYRANLYHSLAKIAVLKGSFKTAFEYQQKLNEVSQQIFNAEQVLNAQKLEIQYESEKKNRELKLLGERADMRKKLNYLYVAIATTLFLGLIFMFRSYHFKLRYSLEREKKMNREKEEAEQNAQMQMKLEKEEQARLKAEKELMRLQHSQLQKEVMTNALQLEHKNEILQQIKEKIADGDAKKVQRLLKEELMMDTDFEDAKSHIQQLHPDFFKKINEMAQQKLTGLDQKYCAYLHLKMNTRQISQLLNVEPQSVRMNKYRLKQKLGLGKEEDLDSFLQTIS